MNPINVPGRRLGRPTPDRSIPQEPTKPARATAQGRALGIGPSGAEHSLAQGGTLGDPRPTARSDDANLHHDAQPRLLRRVDL